MAATVVNGRYIQHTAAADTTTGRQIVKLIIWHGVTDASHTLQVKDGDGTIVLPAIAAGATGMHQFDVDPLPLDGIETDVIGSGTVVYLLR